MVMQHGNSKQHKKTLVICTLLSLGRHPRLAEDGVEGCEGGSEECREHEEEVEQGRAALGRVHLRHSAQLPAGEQHVLRPALAILPVNTATVCNMNE